MWSSKSLGSKFKYGFFTILIKLRLTWLGRLIIFPIPLYYALLPATRTRIMPYLRRRFPNASRIMQFLNVFILYNNFAHVLFDRIVIGTGGDVPILHDVSSMKLIKNALKEGNGCVIVSAHFGCWQTGLMGLKQIESPIAVVFWQEEKIENDFFHYDDNVNIINACGGVESVIKMRNVLKANGILCIMGDRITPGDKKFAKIKFLADKIAIPIFPYLLAKAMNTPTILAASVRKHGVIFGLPAVRINNLDEAPMIFAAFLDKLVSDYPHDFFNFYDMWANDE